MNLNPLRRALWPLLAGCGLAALLSGCSAQEKSEDEEEPAIPVVTAQVAVGPMTAAYHGTATIEALQEAVVVAKLGGVVEHIAVEEGDRVVAEQILARLDDDRLLLEAARARASYQQRASEFKRTESVFKRDLVSREDFDRVRFELDAAQAALELAELSVRESVIRAPFAGVVAARFIKSGNTIQTGAQAFRVVRLDQLEANLHVPERQIYKLAAGQPAQLTVDAWPGQSFAGEVARISPVVDADTGTVKVTVRLAPAQEQLRPGMFGRLRIVFEQREAALLIPKDAVLVEDAAESVYVITDGVAARRSIRTGFGNDGLYEVTDGLVAGESVVTTGQASLKDGARVEVIPATGS